MVRLHQLPTYLSELVVDYAPVRELRSSDKILLVVPRMKNIISHGLSASCHPKSGTVYHQDIWSSIFILTFQQRLKTHLFDSAYH